MTNSLFRLINTALALAAGLFSITVSAAEIPVATPESVGMSAPRLARIETAMQRYIDEDLTPGVITAIVRKGKLVHFSARRHGRRAS
jgi:hypothetical protein